METHSIQGRTILQNRSVPVPRPVACVLAELVWPRKDDSGLDVTMTALDRVDKLLHGVRKACCTTTIKFIGQWQLVHVIDFMYFTGR